MMPVTVTGFLVDGITDIGGETTGWKLQLDDLSDIEVDIEQVKPQALKLRNQFVTITGRYTTREYVERGPTEVLVAEQIYIASSQ